jgi:hypothetical protein
MDAELDGLDPAVAELLAECPERSRPGGWYSAAGDCVFYVNEDVPYLRERVDGLLTVYRATDETRRIVGVQVKGIRSLPEHDLLRINVGHGDVEIVSLLFVTFARPAPSVEAEARREGYREAIEALGRPVRVGELLAG